MIESDKTICLNSCVVVINKFFKNNIRCFFDIHHSLDVDPRVMFAFEDVVVEHPEGADPPDDFHLPLVLTWTLPPLPNGPASARARPAT